MSQSHSIECLVIGAGISGLMAATRLKEAGIHTLILDKGRGMGGRMACRRMMEARMDHGAQFFTQRNADLNLHIESWIAAGIIKKWYSSSNDICWRGTHGMADLPKYLASNLEVKHSSRVMGIEFSDSRWRSETENGQCYESKYVIITAPMPQTCALLEKSGAQISNSDFIRLRSVRYTRCLAALLLTDGPSTLSDPGILKPEDSDAETIVDNQIKGISANPAITVHSTPDFAEKYWDSDDKERLPKLIAAARPYLGRQVLEASIHRWGFAKTINPLSESHYFHPRSALAIAGDGFIAGRVEAAMLSGLAAANSILSALS